MDKIKFLGTDGTFSMEQPEDYSYLYFPIAGEKGLKSFNKVESDIYNKLRFLYIIK